MTNRIRLQFVEKTFEVEYKGKFYKVIHISDWERGDFETSVFTTDMQSVEEKERQDVLNFFNENADDNNDYEEDDDEN